MGDARGQATVEWIGLVLVAALVLGALATFRAPSEDRALGAELAKRVRCAAAGGCGASLAVAGAAPTRPAAPPPALPTGRRISREKAVDAFRRLRGLGALTKRLWILCLGYRRYVYERDHPLGPTQVIPVREALDIANECLNPLDFLTGD
jgi:hypothetical protein